MDLDRIMSRTSRLLALFAHTLTGALVFYAEQSPAAEDGQRLRSILLYKSGPGDELVSTPYSALRSLRGPDTKTAAKIIREVLTNVKRQVDPFICIEAINKYGAFQETEHLRRYVQLWEERYSKDPDFPKRFLPILLRAIALYGGNNAELAEYTKQKAKVLFEKVYLTNKEPHRREADIIIPLLQTITLLKGSKELSAVRKSAQRAIRKYEKTYRYRVVEKRKVGTRGITITVFEPVGEEPSLAQEERHSLDEEIIEEIKEAEFLIKQWKAAEAKVGDSKWKALATFTFWGDPESNVVPTQWATVALRRDTDVSNRSRAVRGALKELLGKSKKDLFESRDYYRLRAYRWLMKHGDGLTEIEQRAFAQISEKEKRNPQSLQDR